MAIRANGYRAREFGAIGIFIAKPFKKLHE
jgi:hypothetical protein